MASAGEFDAFLNQFNVLNGLDYERLIARPDWGPMNFTDCRPELELLRHMLAVTKNAKVRSVPDVQINVWTRYLNKVRNGIEAIEGLTVERGNERDGLADNLRSCISSLFITMEPYLPLLADDETGLSTVFQTAESMVTENRQAALQRFNKEVEALNTGIQGLRVEAAAEVEHIRGMLADTETLAASVRELADTTGVAVFIRNFREEVDNQRWSSRWWLSFTIAFTLLTLGAAVFPTGVGLALWHPVPDGDYLQSVASNAAFIVVLLAATLWCGRKFKVARHLMAVNQHRVDCLNTFEGFTSSAKENTGTRNALLPGTTHAIFARISMGLVEQAEDGDGILNGLETAKRLKV